MLVSAVGNAIATGTTVLGARYFAMFLMPMGAISACENTRSSSFFFLVPLLTSFFPLSFRHDSRLMGGQFFPAPRSQALRLHCHRQHDWQHRYHLRFVHVPQQLRPSLYTWR